jgi:peptidoglycan/LPS O-acetylase OafA/YrhL
VVIGRAWGWHNGTLWVWLYTGTATRADSLLVGALLAIAGSRLAIRGTRWLSPAAWTATAFLALCVAFAEFDTAPLYVGGFTLVALASATVILATLPGSSWQGARPLQWAPLCALGVVSYGLYLWHGLVFAGVQRWGTNLPSVARAVIALAITALVTYLSWVLVEQPFLRWKSRINRRLQDAPTASPSPAETAVRANGSSPTHGRNGQRGLELPVAEAETETETGKPQREARGRPKPTPRA